MIATRQRPPLRAAFREQPNGAEALALDMSLFGNLQRPGLFGLHFDVPRCGLKFLAEPGENPWGDLIPSSIIDGGISVLDLRGPIEHHSCYYWNNYEDLAAEIEKSCAHADVKRTVLCIDSPGGVCAGMQEAHKEIRRIAKVYGKPILAYVSEQACSAAYCIASACSEIWMPDAGQVGSVGVILCTIDETEALEKAGLKIRYVVTGKRKADMHPGSPITDEVLRIAQEKVDYSGRLFFAAVGAARGISAAKVEGYQAAVFCGAAAVKAGLADGIASWPKFNSLVRDSIGPNAKPVATVPADVSAAARALGAGSASRAGRASSDAMTILQRKKRARKAADARWGKGPANAR